MKRRMRRCGERAQSLAEFAMVLPVFLILVFFLNDCFLTLLPTIIIVVVIIFIIVVFSIIVLVITVFPILIVVVLLFTILFCPTGSTRAFL